MTGENKNSTNTTQNQRLCEWDNCKSEGRFRIQTTANRDDIHWFCHIHARMFDLSVVSDGPFFGSAGPNWTQKQNASKQSEEKPINHNVDYNDGIRLRHIDGTQVMKYTKEDMENLKTLGLESGAKPDEIKKAYKRLVKHCHPDQNPDLEHGTLIFNRVNEAYSALKDKDFT